MLSLGGEACVGAGLLEQVPMDVASSSLLPCFEVGCGALGCTIVRFSILRASYEFSSFLEAHLLSIGQCYVSLGCSRDERWWLE